MKIWDDSKIIFINLGWKDYILAPFCVVLLLKGLYENDTTNKQ